MLSNSLNKRRLDDLGDELAGGERKKPRSHRNRTHDISYHNSDSPHFPASASGTPNPYGPTPTESEDDYNVTRGLQHGNGDKRWLNSTDAEHCTGMVLDFDVADSYQGTPANTPTPWSPVPLNAPVLSPIPSRLVSQSLNMNDGNHTPPINEHSYLNAGGRDGNEFKVSYFDAHASMIGNAQVPPSPVSNDGKLPLGGHDVSMDCDALNGDQHSGNRFRGASNRGANRGRMIIAMGYRADCEKCQLRVPGHYSHFVRV